MSTFIPNPGDLCYLTFRPRKVIRMMAFGGDEVETIRDRSYSGVIFKMDAIDSTLAVLSRHAGDSVHGGKVSVRVNEVTFDPVSPDVLAALGGTQ
jgi:hypothetical protein